MTPPPVAALGDRFDEAIDAFRETAPAFDAAFDEIRSAASSRAFTIAGVTRADVVASVWRAMDVAIASGEAMATFRAAVLPALASAWGVSGDKAAPRVETIFRTNAAVAYNAGRYRQARHPDTVRLRPIWRFDALLDGRTSSICRTCHGTTLPADHPWWRTHLSPLHHRCRSSFVTLRASQVEPGEMTDRPPEEAPTGGFGRPPEDPWRPDPNAYPAPLRPAIHRALAPPPPLPA